MAIDNYRKVKLLKLLELLRQHTDAENPMTTAQICDAMEAMGIPCDRRIVTQDVAVLNEMGYEILSDMVGHEKVYFVEDRSFSLPELKILMDAVQASSFITARKSQELIEKLSALAGSHRGEVLKRNMVCFNTRKHSNEKILYIIDTLEEAILSQKKVIFLYFDLDENGQRVYRRNGHHYVTEPIALVFNEDNYYMSCYSSRFDSTSNYRVDRMDGVKIIDEPCCEKAVSLRDQVASYTEQAFKMFSGQLEDVVLEFDRKLIGVVYDKFGESVKMIPSGESKCIATVKVRISPTFWGWLFQFAGQMKILSPSSLVSAYREQAKLVE